MGKTTYKSLYQMVLEEIENKVSYSQRLSTSSQLTNNRISPYFADYAADERATQENQYITELLTTVIEPRILSGLCVKAHTPNNDKILVYPGKGISFGNLSEVTQITQLQVPFDGVTEVFYVVLWPDRLLVQKTEDFRKLTIAKIIVPNPQNSIVVADDRDDDPNSWNSFIMMRKAYQLYGDCDGIFEEDTVDMLRENIGPILADNLIGNIRLSEDLKIINTQGTMELNSSEMNFYDVNENLMAKFDREGTYFYDTNGVELAKFTTTGAKVGNINVDIDRIRSGNFQSGVRGFEITDTGFAEFEDVCIRGRIAASVFEYDKVSAVGGQLMVANSTVISNIIAPTDTTITVDTQVFSVGDILIMKDGINSEYMLVTDVNGLDITVERDYGNSYDSGEPLPEWNAGTAIVSTGSGESGCDSGYVMIDAQSPYSPFIDIVSRNSSEVRDFSVRARLGNLTGITDPLYGNLEGYGLYSDNVYLTGHFYAPDIKTAITGSRIEMNIGGMQAYDSLNNTIFQLITQAESGGLGEGDIMVGNDPRESGNQGILWDNSTGTLCLGGQIEVAGLISADCICGGTLNLGKGIIITNTTPPESGEIAPWTSMDEHGIISYNCQGRKTFCLDEGHLYSEDIRLQDPNCCCIYTCLSGGAFMYHDECGDTQYLKRIKTGCAYNGTTIYLSGWKDMPEIAVFPVSLYTYSSDFVASCQKFTVYYDNVYYYSCEIESGDPEYESGIGSGEQYLGQHYGWQFDVHAALFNADGVQPECIYNISMNDGGMSFSTSPETCATQLQFKFRAYRTVCEDLNWQYGTFNYCISAYLIGNPSINILCSYYYEQPHASIQQLKSWQQVTQFIQFPSQGTWCICAFKSATYFSWNRSSLCARNYARRVDCFWCACCAPNYIDSCNISSQNCFDITWCSCDFSITPIAWPEMEPAHPFVYCEYCVTGNYQLFLQSSYGNTGPFNAWTDGLICICVCTYDGNPDFPDEYNCTIYNPASPNEWTLMPGFWHEAWSTTPPVGDTGDYYCCKLPWKIEEGVLCQAWNTAKTWQYPTTPPPSGISKASITGSKTQKYWDGAYYDMPGAYVTAPKMSAQYSGVGFYRQMCCYFCVPVYYCWWRGEVESWKMTAHYGYQEDTPYYNYLPPFGDGLCAGNWGAYYTGTGNTWRPYMEAEFLLIRCSNLRIRCWCEVTYANRDGSTDCLCEDIGEVTVDDAYLFSKCDYYGCFCTIDGNGIVGWLAMGYK